MKFLQRFAKAIVPALLTVLGVLAYWLATGHFDRVALAGAVVGLVGSAITFFVPNAAPEVQAIEAALPDPENMLSAETPTLAAVASPPAPAPPPAPPTAPAPPTPPAA